MLIDLRKYIYRQNFNPGLLGVFINPFFFARRGLYSGVRKYAAELKGNVLDVGCGRKPYRNLFQVDQYIGMDIENPGHDHSNEEIDVYYDGKTFPFEEAKFDSVMSSEVLEHVFEPEDFLREVNRVLKQDGRLLLTVPFMWDEHEQPNDYARYSSFGLKHVLEKNGFQVLSLTKSALGIRAVVQLFNLYVYKKFRTKSRVINTLLTIVLLSPFTMLGVLFSKVLPRGQDMYLNNIVVAKKVRRADLQQIGLLADGHFA